MKSNTLAGILVNPERRLLIVANKESGHGRPVRRKLRGQTTEELPRAQIELRVMGLELMQDQPKALTLKLGFDPFRLGAYGAIRVCAILRCPRHHRRP
jgi:hypothetical protein